MCRLLGYVMRRPTAARATLAEGQFEDFTALSSVHADGWGMAWTQGGALGSATSPRAAADDERYHDLAGKPLGDAGLVHLRWATDGLEVAPENTHPFVEDGLALAHNGSIQPVDRLDSLLAGHTRDGLRGTTDSERYFRLVLQERARGCSDVEAVQRTVARMLQEFGHASLNALVLSPSQLIAVHASRTAAAPLSDLEELFPGLSSAPMDHVEAYFQMRYRETAEGVVVTSTGYTQSDWVGLPHNSMLVIDRVTCATRVVDLASSLDAAS
ncbi:MAG TPA: class II glutamine amidotransferase [Segeticoccus sp.]|uniref:class II glutamine amidotransferase n=1 Tax=Segeticoccus sp. TaxID=2706531 RepID=UPI002D803F2B|nr:class II glutamine amidotransferase [Segeticoccus sp.]HET8598854.1 class II glutamine amidotransferase [Segeticoccus sp.]